MPRTLPSALRTLALLALALALPAALALTPPTSPDDGPTHAVTRKELEPSIPMSDELREALAERRHSDAARLLAATDRAKLAGNQVGDHAFLTAWSLVHAGRAKEAVSLVELVGKAEHVPRPYVDLVRGEVLLADGQAVAAAAELDKVPEGHRLWPRAELSRASALRAAGRQSDAKSVYEALISRPDPAEGSELALEALAAMSGNGSPAAYPYDRRLWAAYPDTASGKRAADRLKSYGPFATWQEQALRVDGLMEAGEWQAAVDLAATVKVEGVSADACRLWYAHGRSLHKLDRMSEAATILEPAGEKCKGYDDDRGAKSLYLAGKSEERKKAWATAAKRYARIAELYPTHTLADDGLALAGIAQQESGDLPGARKTWAEQVHRYPDGDLAAEGYWRLAWGAYIAGDTTEAIRWADESVECVPVATDPVHVHAARYWSARWRAWPDAADPKKQDPAGKAKAIEIFSALLRDAPFSFYAMLAADRLTELNPEKVPTAPVSDLDAPLEVREAFMKEGDAAIQLAQLGLYKEARSELEAMDVETFTPAEMALYTELRWAAGDWLMAHDNFRRWLATRPPEQLGKQRDRILALAYPNQYWAEVKAAASSYGWDPRMFHALVREESNFNKNIVSHAGARGLSQLMPATARTVAGWMGTTVSVNQLFDPATNLKIGARYFQFLMERYKGNPYLATAAYNAGEGNVDKWLKTYGNVPSDEFVERIPFRETRGYVKRVQGTYHVYHLLYDPGPDFPDRSDWMYAAVP